MSGDYQLQDIITQNANLVTYRVLWKDGTPFALTRLQMEGGPLKKLDADNSAVFRKALAALREIRNPHIAEVIDGGQDEVDRYPWIVSEWRDGKPISERKITEPDIRTIRDQLKTLIDDLGKKAGALLLDSHDITTCRCSEGKLLIRCSINYHQWFLDFADGREPGHTGNVEEKVGQLISDLTAARLRNAVDKNRIAIPMVDEPSPALARPEPSRDGRLSKILTALLLLAALGALAWITWKGEQKKALFPREEISIPGQR